MACVETASVTVPPIVKPGSEFTVRFGLRVNCPLQLFTTFFFIDEEEVDSSWGFHIFPGTWYHEWKLKAPSETGTHVVRIATDQEMAEGKHGVSVNFFVGSAEEGYGFVHITSEPSGATVIIDSKVVGTTPLIQKLQVGEHTITVKMEGYITKTQKIVVEEGKVKYIRFELEKEPSKDWMPVLALGLVGISLGGIVAYAKHRGD